MTVLTQILLTSCICMFFLRFDVRLCTKLVYWMQVPGGHRLEGIESKQKYKAHTMYFQHFHNCLCPYVTAHTGISIYVMVFLA